MASEPEPAGEIHVEREEASVIIKIDEDDGTSEYHLPPIKATQVAMWLNQAAADAKQWQQQGEGSSD